MPSFSKVRLPSCLAQHVHHLCLEYGVNSLDTNSSSRLGHGENVHDFDCEIVDKLAEHQAHDFHGHTSAAVSQHLEQGEGRNIDGLGVVDQARVVLHTSSVSDRRRSAVIESCIAAYRSVSRAAQADSAATQQISEALHDDLALKDTVRQKMRLSGQKRPKVCGNVTLMQEKL